MYFSFPSPPRFTTENDFDRLLFLVPKTALKIPYFGPKTIRKFGGGPGPIRLFALKAPSPPLKNRVSQPPLSRFPLFSGVAPVPTPPPSCEKLGTEDSFLSWCAEPFLLVTWVSKGKGHRSAEQLRGLSPPPTGRQALLSVYNNWKRGAASPQTERTNLLLDFRLGSEQEKRPDY